MRFLVDRCAGHRLAEWLRSQGYDVLESPELGPDPGARALLERAAAAGRILVTIDTDFGELVYVEEVPHGGLVRLPDVPAEPRIALMTEVLDRHQQALETQAIITIRLVGTIPPEVWNRLGTKVLPKLRTGNDLRVDVDLSVSLNTELVQSMVSELRQILQDLDLEDRLRIAQDEDV